MKKFLRLLGKSTAFFLLSLVWTGMFVVYEPEDPAHWRLLAEFWPLFGVVVTSRIFGLYIDKKEFRLKGGGDLLSSTIHGGIVGFLWIGSAFGILMLLGNVTLGEFEMVPKLWIWVLAVLLNAGMQELLVRGYLYKMLHKNAGASAAVIVTTALFTLLHGGAFSAGWIAVLNVLTMSLLMTAMMIYTDTLWAPILAHFIWNVLGGVVLGGVSLAEDYPHLWAAAFSGPDWLSGGVYKLEGSIVVLVLNVSLLLFYIMLMRRKEKYV